MAIQFYCGSPGAGKSYHVVRYVILPALIAGRCILTNLPVKLKEIYEAYPQLKEQDNYLEFVEHKQIRDLHEIVDCEKYAGWLIVIDEAHDYWPSHNFIKEEGFRSWLSQSRHKMQDVILVTQDFANVAKFIRGLTKERWHFEKNDARGFSKSYMQDYFTGISKKRVTREIRKYDPEYFNYYDSHDTGLLGNGFQEVHVGKKMNIMKKPYWYLVVGVAFFLFGFNMFFSKGHSEELKTAGKSGSISKAKVLKSNHIEEGRSVAGLRADYGWCRTIVRIGAGKLDYKGVKGFAFSGEDVILKGAFIVVGMIGSKNQNIYLLKGSNMSISRIKIPTKTYEVGQKICL